MKTVLFSVLSAPDRPAIGYADCVSVIDDGSPVYTGRASTCPNPYAVGDSTPWENLYGWIADGEYKWQCVDHPRFGKCLLVNGGREVKSRNPKRPAMTEIFVHRGAIKSKNPNWRGSRGCMTVPPNDWDAFTAKFKTGETGKLIIITKDAKHA